MNGLHIMGDMFNCKGNPSYLIELESIKTLCLDLIKLSKLQTVEEKFFQFPDWNGYPGGVTGCVLLAESHLAIHTWPENRGVTLDIYVCNFTEDNSTKAEILFDGLVRELDPSKITINRVWRAEVQTGTSSFD